MNKAGAIYRRERRTVQEAMALLSQRYREQCERYPRTREIPESLYISRNLKGAIAGPWVEIERA